MTKMVCDFQFDGATYCVMAELDGAGDVRDLHAISSQRGARACDVRTVAAFLGTLLRNGLPFGALANMRLSPIAAAMVASLARAQSRARRAPASFSASAKGKEA